MNGHEIRDFFIQIVRDLIQKKTDNAQTVCKAVRIFVREIGPRVSRVLT